MNPPRCTDTDYIDFLVATPRAVSCVEATRVQPRRADAPAHDAFTRLLHRFPPDPAALWEEVAPLVDRTKGILVGDNSMLDKPYAAQMDLVTCHWSGKHHAVVDGINLITLVWTDGDWLIPIDYRVYDKARDGITKNEHLLAMLLTARQRGFTPERVVLIVGTRAWAGGPVGRHAANPRLWLAVADATESESPRQPRSDGQPGGARLRNHRERHGRAIGRIWDNPGVPHCHPRQ